MTAARFFAVVLIVIGVLMVLLCGGCTLTVLASALYDAANHHTATLASTIMTTLLVVGVVGGLPTAAGAVLVWAGWRMLKTRPVDSGGE